MEYYGRRHWTWNNYHTLQRILIISYIQDFMYHTQIMSSFSLESTQNTELPCDFPPFTEHNSIIKYYTSAGNGVHRICHILNWQNACANNLFKIFLCLLQWKLWNRKLWFTVCIISTSIQKHKYFCKIHLMLYNIKYSSFHKLILNYVKGGRETLSCSWQDTSNLDHSDLHKI